MNLPQKLGFSKRDKLLIIHADDAGLTHSENIATIQSIQKGCINSYSIMVPCSGYQEIAEFALKNSEFDYGVHLTLTCEWENSRWGPVLPVNEVPSLVDKDGFFHKSKFDFKNCNASITDIKKELRAQIQKALDFGLKPSHLDSHMYTLGLKYDFLKVYKELGEEFKIPILLSKYFVESFGLKLERCFQKDVFFVKNDILMGNFKEFESGNLISFYEQNLNNLESGLNIFLLHTAFDNLEMQNLTINHPNFGAKWRQIDYDFVISKKCKEILIKNDIKLITWRQIKDVLYP